MSSLRDYFKTDWAAMTTTDWVGLTVTVVIFVLMVIAYVYVLRPKNREKLEQRKYQMDDEQVDSGEK